MTDFLNNIVSAWNDEEDPDSELYPDETNSPNINILIRNARKFLDDKLDQESFMKEIDATTERLETAMNELADYSDRLPEDDPSRELAEKSEIAYDEFAAGLEEMEAATPDGVTKGIELCIEAAFKLESLNQHYLQLEAQRQMIECVMCSHHNTPGRSDCEKCGATLPTALKSASGEAGPASDLVMVPQEYMDLYEACDNVAANEIPLEEWQAHIDAFNERFNQASQQIHDITSTNRETFSKVPGILDQAESVVDALDETLEALYRMQQFADDGDPDHLNQGWMQLLAGTQKVQERGLTFYQNLEAAQESQT